MQWGGSGWGFPHHLLHSVVGTLGVAVILRGLPLQQHVELPNILHLHCSDKGWGSTLWFWLCPMTLKPPK